MQSNNKENMKRKRNNTKRKIINRDKDTDVLKSAPNNPSKQNNIYKPDIYSKIKKKLFNNNIEIKLIVILAVVGIVCSVWISDYYQNKITEENKVLLQEFEKVKMQNLTLDKTDNNTVEKLIKTIYGKTPKDINLIIDEYTKSSNDFYDIGLYYSAKGNLLRSYKIL